MKDVLDKFQDIIKKSNAKVSCGSMPELTTSPTLIQVLFQNLIGNALKFQDGSRVPEVNIHSEKKDNGWVFCVNDNGIGIDPSFYDRVFSIFQQYHRREQFSGTGIGLSTCKKFIELFGGSIWFVSEQQNGSSFYFFIPQKG